MKKRIFALVFIVIFNIGSVFMVSAESAQYDMHGSARDLAFEVEIADGVRSAAVRLPGRKGSDYALFLPSDCDTNSLVLRPEGASVNIDGKSFKSGDTAEGFIKNSEHTVESLGHIYSLRIFMSENIPAVFIETGAALEDIHNDREHKVPAVMTVYEQGTVTLFEEQLSYIKGRGNSSWVYNDKKSYNIKFENKTGLFGMAEAKKWALVSNNMDKTLLKNAVAYSAAKLTDLRYTVDFEQVDLFIDHEYRGNYLLCEKIEVGGNRIDIRDLDDANEDANPGIDISEAERIEDDSGFPYLSWFDLKNEPDDISGGYLLEYDLPEVFYQEKSGFVTGNETCLILHSPEYASEKEIKYIAGLYNDFEESLLSGSGKNSKGRDYSSYIDLDSFVDAVVIRELTENEDRGHTSWYIYMPEKSERFYMGPLWDFDQSMTDAQKIPDCFVIAAESMFRSGKSREKQSKQTFLELLCAKTEITDLAAKRFSQMKDIFEGPLCDIAAELEKRNSASAQMDAARWDYERDDMSVVTYLKERIAYLGDAFSDPSGSIRSCYNEMYNANSEGAGRQVNAAGLTLCIVLIITGVLILLFYLYFKVRSVRLKNKRNAEKAKKNDPKKRRRR